MYLKCSCYSRISKFSTWEKRKLKLLLIKWAVAELSAGCYLNSHSETMEVCFQAGKEGVFKLCSGHNYVHVQSQAWHS